MCYLDVYERHALIWQLKKTKIKINEDKEEKLDVKQTELESLSSELSEVLKTRDKLEEELSVLKDQADRVKQDRKSVV